MSRIAGTSTRMVAKAPVVLTMNEPELQCLPQLPPSSPSSSSSPPSWQAQPPLPAAASPPQRPETTPTVRLPFTFILQHKDIRSVRDRRIQDPNHRHEIRSHVMRNVRQHESIQGVKRPTGGGRARKLDRGRKLNKDANQDSAVAVNGCQQTRGQVKAMPDSSGRAEKQVRFGVVHGYALPLYESLGVSDQLYRFCQRSDNALSETAIRDLLSYASSHFIPMTFPVDDSNARQRLGHHVAVQRALDSRPASFFAFLATLACHRAVVYNQHSELGGDNLSPHCERIKDLDFIHAHRCSIAEAEARACKAGRMDADYLEACFGIVSTYILAGDFDASRRYLDSIRDIVPQVQLTSDVAALLPMADIKVAVGLLTRPRVALLWTREPIAYAILDHIRPSSSEPLSLAGSSFGAVPGLSAKLQALLRDAVFICQMYDFNARHCYGLSDAEHIVFRCKSLELEHDLLDYVFDTFPSWAKHPDSPEPSVDVPPTENVVRLAVIGLMSIVSVHVLPGCGLGRALTRHQMNTIQNWFATSHHWRQQYNGNENLTGNPRGDEAALGAIMWALFVFAQCAKEQKEEETFRQMLAEVTIRLQLFTWDQIEEILYTFLYVPTALFPTFYRTWEAIEAMISAGDYLQSINNSTTYKQQYQPGPGIIMMMDEG